MFALEASGLPLWIVVLLFFNAYFAAAGAALASVRPSRLEELAAAGHAGARAAVRLLANPERLLTLVQLGASASTLALGWAGQEGLRLLWPASAVPDAAGPQQGFARAALFVMVLLVLSYVHAAVAEVVPKNLALAKAEKWALLSAPPLALADRALAPLLWLLERSAGALARALGFRGAVLGGGQAVETLKLLIRLHRRHSQLDSFEEGALERLLELRDYLTREIMIPRSEIVSLPVEASAEEALERMGERQLWRLPVYQGEPEKIVGLVVALDLIAARARPSCPASPGERTLLRLMRKPLVVPETKPVHQLLRALWLDRTRMALVVDEHGTVTGVITLEDVLEQLFGKPAPQEKTSPLSEERASAPVELDGATTIRELETRFGIELPADPGYETLAGFILFRLGDIPRPGDTVTYHGLRFTVLEMEKKRIARVRLERLPEDPIGAEL